MQSIFPVSALFLLTSLLGGCMWARSDGIVDSQGGTYRISARTDGFTTERTMERAHAKAYVYDEARDFCSQKNSQVFLVDDKGPEMAEAPATAAGENPDFSAVTIRFRCGK